jgi:hypothetical protein
MGSKNTFDMKKTAIAVLAVVGLGAGSLMLSGCDEGGMSAVAAESGQGHKGGQGGAGKGGGKGVYQRGSANKSLDALLEADDGGEEDSDRPDWAGSQGKEGKPGSEHGGSAGSDTKKGVDYGDLWVILRDDNGVPILKDGFVQPLDADGNLIPLDEEGHPIDESLVVEVELGRLNIARAPDKVLEHSLVEALSKLSSATVVTLDPSGRFVVDGNTIDSPLENLALFEAILTTPAVDGVIHLETTATVDGQEVTYSFDVSLEEAGLVAASAIAAASDKTGTLTIDEVMYIAKFLGLDEELSDFVKTFNYERDDVYTDDLTVWILEGQDTNGDGEFDVYYPKEVVINQVVDFNDVPTTSNGTGIDEFTQAAEDSVQVLEYVHDNALDQ